jgi:hypothetical protein
MIKFPNRLTFPFYDLDLHRRAHLLHAVVLPHGGHAVPCAVVLRRRQRRRLRAHLPARPPGVQGVLLLHGVGDRNAAKLPGRKLIKQQWVGRKKQKTKPSHVPALHPVGASP